VFEAFVSPSRGGGVTGSTPLSGERFLPIVESIIGEQNGLRKILAKF
jgi:hypothetical protein